MMKTFWTSLVTALMLFHSAWAVDHKTTAVELRAADGISVFGTAYWAKDPRATILLFHQAGASRIEYKTIAPRLVQAGYNVLAIDQRAGGNLFGGNNATAKRFGHEASYLEAKPDLQAALDWALMQHLPVILWGSSYSSALVFLLAAENPGKVAALLSFSPNEYLGSPKLVGTAAASVNIPMFVTSSMDTDEIAGAKAILSAAPSNAKTQFVPKKGGVHGSSTLDEKRNAKGAEENWLAVLTFLQDLKL